MRWKILCFTRVLTSLPTFSFFFFIAWDSQSWWRYLNHSGRVFLVKFNSVAMHRISTHKTFCRLASRLHNYNLVFGCERDQLRLRSELRCSVWHNTNFSFEGVLNWLGVKKFIIFEVKIRKFIRFTFSFVIGTEKK